MLAAKQAAAPFVIFNKNLLFFLFYNFYTRNKMNRELFSFKKRGDKTSIYREIQVSQVHSDYWLGKL